LYYGSNKAKRVWGIVRLDGCKVMPISSKKGGFAFKIYHPENKFIYSTKGLQGETIKSAYMPGGGSVMKLRILSEQDRDDWMRAVEIACSGIKPSINVNSSSPETVIVSEDVSQEQQSTSGGLADGVSVCQLPGPSLSASVPSLMATNINTKAPSSIANSNINNTNIQPTPRARVHGSSSSPASPSNLPPPPNPNSGYSMEITADMRNYYDGEIEVRNVSGKSWIRRWIVVRKGLLVIFNSETVSIYEIYLLNAYSHHLEKH